MKTWAWVAGGLGLAAGAWYWLKRRESMPASAFYPEGVVPGETPGYPVAPSAEQLPPDVEGGFAPSMGTASPTTGESYVSAPTVGTPDQSVSQKSIASQSAGFAMGTHAGSYGKGTTQSTSQGAQTTSAKAASSSLSPFSKKAVVTTYKSPITSATTVTARPVMSKPTTVSAPTVIKPLPPKPVPTVKSNLIRGMYAIGADHTEAEYKAMAARAALEAKRREWAASQLSERIAAITCMR